jgi:hypothetical protein
MILVIEPHDAGVAGIFAGGLLDAADEFYAVYTLRGLVVHPPSRSMNILSLGDDAAQLDSASNGRACSLSRRRRCSPGRR